MFTTLAHVLDKSALRVDSSTLYGKGISPARIESRHLFILELIPNISFTVDFTPWMLILYY
jgi:hypothetical protein